MLEGYIPRQVLAAGAMLVAAAGIGAGAAIGIDRAIEGSPAKQTAATPVATVRETVPATTRLDPATIYERTAPGVVEITVTAISDGYGPFGSSEVESEGSGFVLDAKGHIVTNEHVVSGAETISVRFSDGTEVEAALVGSDPSTDVAVIRVDVPAKTLEPLELGTSAGVEPGESVFALGSPFGLEGSISAGIVSAIDRTITAPNGVQISGAIQTDAGLNKGSSGGPLLDSEGKVIGLNAQIESQTGTGNGVGFAIPIDTVRTVASQLAAGSTVEHGFLGVRVQTVTAAAAERLGLPRGAQVAGVEPGSPAAKAGLKAGTEAADGLDLTEDGDVIVSLDGKPITSGDQLAAAVAARAPGDKITLVVVRKGDRRTVTVTLGSRSS